MMVVALVMNVDFDVDVVVDQDDTLSSSLSSLSYSRVPSRYVAAVASA